MSRPRQISFSELLEYPKHTITSFHECAGSPLAPAEPTRRICNLRWGGARLADILRDCGREARKRGFSGPMEPTMASSAACPMDAYQKDLPLERIRRGCPDRLRDERCATSA